MEQFGRQFQVADRRRWRAGWIHRYHDTGGQYFCSDQYLSWQTTAYIAADGNAVVACVSSRLQWIAADRDRFGGTAQTEGRL